MKNWESTSAFAIEDQSAELNVSAPGLRRS
jgi:hypothetical protein